MDSQDKFIQHITEGYSPKGDYIYMGAAMLNSIPQAEARRKAIILTAENYPISEYYDTKEVLTSLGIGEALISVLDERGRPTPLAATRMRAPMSRMDILSPKEINEIISASQLEINTTNFYRQGKCV